MILKQLLPEIWKNKGQILEGIKNLTFKKEHIEEIKSYRESICKECIWYNKKYKSVKEVPEIISQLKTNSWIEELIDIESPKCIHCGCNIGENSIKLRCLSCSCPIGKWANVTSEEEESKIKKIIENEQ